MAARKRGVIARLIAFLFKLVFGFVLLSVVIVAIYRFVPPPTTITMLTDENGATRDWTALDRIDRNMVSAAIAAEDGKFCTHSGFDREAIEEAVRRNAQGGRIRGGSTISQQTAKNVFLWQNGGFFRKGLEAWFTVLIEGIWGKRRIMEVYLNVAETGIGTYGVEAGAQRYFGKGAASLSRDEAARMAAALPLPKKRSVKNPSGFVRRYGNNIARRIRIVQRDGLDACARP
jgi:monofunctional biosynthetic peptidoglycan transglycosylase